LTRDLLLASIGASGAVYGVVGCYLALQAHRRLGFTEYSFEYDTWIALMVWGGLEVLSMWKGRKGASRSLSGENGGKDHVAHIGGLVAGAGAGYWLRWKAEEAKKGVIVVEDEDSDGDGGSEENERGVMEVSTVSGPSMVDDGGK
jgi:membrane associated rhomboid family serine protease